MTDWIEINLPWSKQEPTAEVEAALAERQVLYERCLRQAAAALGISREESVRQMAQVLWPGADLDARHDMDVFVAARERAPELQVAPEDRTEAWLSTIRQQYAADAAVVAIAQHWHNIYRIDQWVAAHCQDELREQYARVDAARASNDQCQFATHPACRPGVQIEVRTEDGEVMRYLLGDINCYAGLSGGCVAFDGYTTTVLRYRELVDPAALDE
jgi:hypothetical protein